ncbi:unnamed protein product [Zymoseptoria tritici ST99CH_1A5]|uniref:Uncharacterized protein n=1 Tax=Zymoseptoria tritici ST99CH_1A5 TaxID=1276529 RepID=A0A1Y6LUV0_ZYMTR|nr:unnamed protein product [Zymoseptoria tritici ST99CH_1A5]
MADGCATHGMFSKLSPELRNEIYFLSLTDFHVEPKDGQVLQDRKTHHRVSRKIPPLAQVNRALRKDLLPMLFWNKHFSFYSRGFSNDDFSNDHDRDDERNYVEEWLRSFGDGLRYVTSMTITSPPRRDYYGCLCDRPSCGHYLLHLAVDEYTIKPTLYFTVEDGTIEIMKMTRNSVENASPGVQDVVLKHFEAAGRTLEELPGVIKELKIFRLGRLIRRPC